MRKRKWFKALTGALSLSLLTSCTINLSQVIQDFIDSIDINAILELIDLDSILQNIIENIDLEELITISEEDAETYIASFNPSSKYDDISTLSLSSSLKETGEDTETISITLDDTLESLALSRSYKKGSISENISVSSNGDGSYTINENGSETTCTQSEAQNYVTNFKEGVIDKYAYSEENYFFDLINNGDNSYYSVLNYIRFQGTYKSSDDTITVYDSAFTLDGLFVAGAIYTYTNDSLTYEYTAYIDYNDTEAQLSDLLS